MKPTSANPPVILSFSAFDPSGAGGIQADIETAASLGCHCAPIITALCTDGSANISEARDISSTIIIEQARSILEGMDVKAIKIGFLGSTANAEAVHSIIRDYANLPVVVHPALFLWDLESPEQEDLPEAFSSLILPLTTVAIFSLYEAREVAQETDTVDTTAHALLSSGCEKTLITGTGKDTQAFRNSLYDLKGLVKHYPWEQEPPTCHGSSSTLTMSAATYMAHGFDSLQALEHAQNFTWQSMRASREFGFSVRTPHRFFWADKNLDAPHHLPADKSTH